MDFFGDVGIACFSCNQCLIRDLKVTVLYPPEGEVLLLYDIYKVMTLLMY